MSSTPDLTARLIESTCGTRVLLAAPVGDGAMFALADGRAAIMRENGALAFVSMWDGADALVAASDGERLVVGASNGSVCAVAPDGRVEVLQDEAGGWIDALAARRDGAVAWSCGKEVRARSPRGEVKTFAAASSVRGLCFMPKGYRLAAACYNGVALWFPNLASTPEFLEWRGSHIDVVASPDGRFVVSSMQENALHGWRLADRKNMRMTGYPSKTRSFSWSADGLWLATSGAEACIVWPFSGKDGPMGRGPEEMGARPARVTQTAFHPKRPVIAVGYDDGWILLCDMRSKEEAMLRSPSEGAAADAIIALAWSAQGDRLWYGTKMGSLGVSAPQPLP